MHAHDADGRLHKVFSSLRNGLLRFKMLDSSENSENNTRSKNSYDGLQNNYAITFTHVCLKVEFHKETLLQTKGCFIILNNKYLHHPDWIKDTDCGCGPLNVYYKAIHTVMQCEL